MRDTTHNSFHTQPSQGFKIKYSSLATLNGTGGPNGHDITCGSGGNSGPEGSGGGPPEGSGGGAYEGSCGDTEPEGSGWGPPVGSGWGPPAGSGWGPHEGGSGDNGQYTECGGTFSDDVGVLSSPNYPAPYPNNADCIYIVSGPANIYITYTLTNMDIEPRDVVSCDDSDGCSDSLKIWDCADGILMNEHCGCSASVSLPIGPIMAMGNSIRIR